MDTSKITVQEVINSSFKDEQTIWFDYIDYVKSNLNTYRMGLRYIKRYGKYEIYLVSDNGEGILICTLYNDQGMRLLDIIKIMHFKQNEP